jgi:hypothetical protein
MVAPLKPDQARALHDNRESYCLFARLPSGELLLLDHKSSWSPHNPDQPTNPNHQPITDLTLWIFHEQRRLIAEFCDQFAEPGTLDFRSVSDQDLARKDEEAVNLFLTMGTWRPAHHRERDLWDQPITNAERALMRIPSPQFGQYEPLIAAANRWLEHGGAERSQLGRAP